MLWFFFFVFSLVALNSVIIWGLLKKAGFEDRTLLLLSSLCLLSACLMYNSTTGKWLCTVPRITEIIKEE